MAGRAAGWRDWRRGGNPSWFAPDCRGGDPITQRVLAGGATVASIPLFFLVRLALGAVFYAAATPGGLFAPMLVLGAQLGSFYGAVCRLAFPDLGIELEAFAVGVIAPSSPGSCRPRLPASSSLSR